MKLYAIDQQDDPETFIALEIKAKINKFLKENPKEKKVPDELLNEAVRWRLS